jgi:hypothetical protein
VSIEARPPPPLSPPLAPPPGMPFGGVADPAKPGPVVPSVVDVVGMGDVVVTAVMTDAATVVFDPGAVVVAP